MELLREKVLFKDINKRVSVFEPMSTGFDPQGSGMHIICRNIRAFVDPILNDFSPCEMPPTIITIIISLVCIYIHYTIYYIVE